MKSGKSSAYTLIEILVVMTVITILFGIGYVSYRDFGRRQALAGAVKQVEGDLRKTQQNALSGIKPPDTACDSGDLSSYQIWINTSDNHNYRIRAICGGTTVLVESRSLEGVSLASTKNPMNFMVLGRGADEATVTLIQDITGKTSTITIGSGGSVSANQ